LPDDWTLYIFSGKEKGIRRRSREKGKKAKEAGRRM
jgi:hypothetical protein